MKKINLENISYSYKTNEDALKSISLNIDQGVFFGIIGPNGSGKSTLLKCVSGYLSPYVGNVKIDNKDIQQFSTKELAKNIALVKQHNAIEYDFTVMDIVLTGRNPYLGILDSESESDFKIANESLKKAGIFHLKNRLITTLSGGEHQRMILARALCQKSSIMLLDEPVAGLDIKHKVEFMSIVKKLCFRENITILCVLHDLNLTYNYCDKIALLKNGELFKSGSPKDVLTKSNLEYVYETSIDIFEANGKKYIMPIMK